MKIKHIKYVILINAIALVGIILIQFFWIKAALKLSENNLDRDVNEALNKVADKVENSEKFRKIIRGLNLMKNGDEDEYAESINEVFENLPGTFHSEPGNTDKGDLAIYLNKSLKKFYQRRSQIADSIVKELMVTDFFTYKTVEDKLEGINIDSLLRSELSFKGINTPVEFGVFEKLQLTKIHSPGFDPNLVQYKTMLLRHDVMSPPVWLYVYLPKRNQLLFKNIQWLTLLNFLFIVIVIISSFITIQQMLTQKEISRIKTDFINNMTHEFKTPISTIFLATKNLTNPKILVDQERMKKYVNIIKEENQRMNQQVEMVLRLALLDKKQLQLRLESFDMLEIVNEAINHMKFRIENRSGRIEVLNNATNTRVFGDKEHIKNVIINLLDNAIKYSFEELEIQVILNSPAPNELHISIKDKGIGMTKNVVEKIFDRFYRQSTGDVHDVKGHGLGLSYVMEILRLHGAKIDVDSAPNKGSTFTIKFKNQ
ncbi:sensor histidine kinase [Schleiferia thermophila]|uniref:histidine kinase n=1 Tax=Schleiferia thermophila TaxID=884107 RepID=A0A369A3T9_9FLAO|nr:HAMP domain-containing sensor histidine kinase [Schleiferia thermophila]RCX03899.1 two-component system phosphate regulon sensor histidine kinase PhoR [Schleiferia thermophila]GCD80131.1 two-component sensor histidine kinase [Schleiferia thermophila]